MLKRDGAGKYANTPETDLFLDNAKPSYAGGMLEMAAHGPHLRELARDRDVPAEAPEGAVGELRGPARPPEPRACAEIHGRSGLGHPDIRDRRWPRRRR